MNAVQEQKLRTNQTYMKQQKLQVFLMLISVFSKYQLQTKYILYCYAIFSSAQLKVLKLKLKLKRKLQLNENKQSYISPSQYNNFMWNIITSNRLLDKKRKQQAQRKHLSALRNIKSSINNESPASYSFLYSRPKAKLMKLERQSDIEYSNNILVEKMISISTINRQKQSFVKDSLNLSFNKKIERQIDLSNEALVRRLRNVSSEYGQRNLGKFVQQYHRAKSNLNRSRVNTTLYDLQMPSKNNIAESKRPFSSKARPFSAKV